MGLLAAENIADGSAHNLWAINADYQYQEDAVITRTGLVRRSRKSLSITTPTPAAALRPV
jgi:hypothetical protein